MLRLSAGKCLCLLLLAVLLFSSCSALPPERLALAFPPAAAPAPAAALAPEPARGPAAAPRPWPARRRRHRRQQRFCPGQDVGSRAYRAPLLLQGQVRSKSAPRLGVYSVTVEVKLLHRPGGLNLTDLIRLKFADRVHHACDDRRVQGLVPARLNNGELYLFFLKGAGLHNYTVLGQPVSLADSKERRAAERQIREVLRGKKVKPAKIVSVKSSNVTFHENVTVTCEVRGNPPPVITWYRNGTELRRRKPAKNIRIKHQERKSTLLIQNFDWGDVARYECRARGVIGNSVSRNITISHSLSSEGSSTECESPLKEHYCLNKGVCVRFKSLEEKACK